MMSKSPLEVPTGRKLSREELLEALRISIIAELDAINLYMQFARAVDDERVRKVFEDVAREEKTHVGEFLALLKLLDAEQATELSAGEKEVRELLEKRSSQA
ncbi:MAG: rubrerythrin [Thermoprotei archaeon]|nr:MAG: rubrerythrin [Thermoprotei archaeon]